jgi:hypothetical protein
MNPLLQFNKLAEEILEQYAMLREDNAPIGVMDKERLDRLVKAANIYLEDIK